MDVAKINVTFAQEKTDQDNSLQITYVTDGVTRNYFVSSESGRVYSRGFYMLPIKQAWLVTSQTFCGIFVMHLLTQKQAHVLQTMRLSQWCLRFNANQSSVKWLLVI